MDTKTRRRRRNNLGMATSVVAAGEPSSPDQFAKLPDELAVEILSRSTMTLNEAARYSLLGKRWRHLWQSIDGGVLDFNQKSNDEQQGNDRNHISHEERRRFADWVDQAISRITATTLDGLRIGFNLFEMEEEARRWIQFGFAARVKQLTLSCYFVHQSGEAHLGVSGSLFLAPEFLRRQDLGRLEVLEFQGVAKIPQGALDHIFSNCPNLQRLSLTNCIFHEEGTVVRVCSPKLQRLTFHFPQYFHFLARIVLLSAPGLHTLEVGGGPWLPTMEFGDDIPLLRELCCYNRGLLIEQRCYFPWSRSQFDKFAPRLQILKYELSSLCFPPLRPYHLQEWVLFEKLTVLDLRMYMDNNASSLLHCTGLLRAAPMLRRFSMSFLPAGCHRFREHRGQSAHELSTWKHHSLQELHLHGVHPLAKKEQQVFDPHLLQLELAAYIIINSPSLNQPSAFNHHELSIQKNMTGDTMEIRSQRAQLYRNGTASMARKMMISGDDNDAE
ncbi:unnamed protein product [Linum trigynum]|uniref:F-box domain-containing protein n=1 Tax=Linum trigynum TaxID=586398 RepID=A0AAV2EK66_9ROSI